MHGLRAMGLVKAQILLTTRLDPDYYPQSVSLGLGCYSDKLDLTQIGQQLLRHRIASKI